MVATARKKETGPPTVQVTPAEVLREFAQSTKRVWTITELAESSGAGEEQVQVLLDAWTSVGVAQHVGEINADGTRGWMYLGRGPGRV